MNNLLHREQVKELYSRAMSNFSAHLFFISIMYYFFQNGRPFSGEFLIATVLLAIFICYRYFFNRNIFQKINDDSNELVISRYHSYFTINIFLLGIFWAFFLAGPVFLLDTSVIQTMLIFNGMVISCMSAMGISRRDNFTFLFFQFVSLSVVLYYKPLSQNIYTQFVLLAVLFLYLLNQQKAMYQTWSKFIFDRIDQQNLLNGYSGILSLYKENKIVFKNNAFDGFAKANATLETEIISQAKKMMREKVFQISFEKQLVTENAENTFSIHLQQRENNEVIVVGVNIQQQKDREEQIKIQQALLEQASKMASLGEMSGGLAHEINNPLAIISLNAQIAKKNIQKIINADMFTREVVLPIEKIELMVDRISKIIKSLRALSRDGINDLKSTISCSSVVDDTLVLCETKFKNSGIVVNKHINESLKIHCRETEISQVLLNVLNNAFDAITDAKNTNPDRLIEIKAFENQDHIQIAISDTGVGVPIEIRDKIMNPYFTTKEIGQGSGIGLSISSNIMKNNGGSLKFDWSQKNTIVQLLLPKPT